MSEPMPSRPADRNLLFGILALQMDFIDRDALITAMHAWVLQKSRALGEILQGQGRLSPERLQLLDALVAEHVRVHGNDPEKSLAALSSLGPVPQDLGQVDDPDLQASLAVAGSAQVADPEATGPFPARSAEGAPAVMRYRILRSHAKGGLGEVFVAFDQELHRQVAVKEIQQRHAHDAVSRGRFLREAEITSELEHPGIVPVYGLGQYADGRPFYAMRFIKGDNLKGAIRRFHEADVHGRDPGEGSLALRQLLRRLIDVCNAVAYAHSRGVLHRDLKPGNIMLGKYGETLIIDWGLAKPVGRADSSKAFDESALQPSSASGLAGTVMGSAIGTPGYMSPEQAAGRLDLLGPASDVYSLGATLYAVLTGRAPFAEKDASDVLEKVERGDFPAPRRVKARLPAALEAICLKAMALQPTDRYLSPAALAEDLEHWLADEPVTAYRDAWPARLGRWGRRHRALAGSSLAALAVGALGLGLLAAVVGVKNADLAVANRREHEAAELAQRTIEDMTSEEALAFLETQKELRPEQRRFLERAVDYYRQTVGALAQGEEAQARQGRAYYHMGYLQDRLGLQADAELSYRAALAEYQPLAAEHPQLPQYRHVLATSHINLGLLLGDQGKRVEAEAEYRAARKELERLAAEHPQVPQPRQNLARSHNYLGSLLKDQGKRVEAEAEYRAALEEQQRLAAEHPQAPQYRQDLAISHNNLGLLLTDLGKRVEAEAEYRAALKEQQRLAAEHTQVPEYRADLARSHNNLGNLLRDQGKPVEAEAEYRTALNERERLVAEHPQVPSYAVDLGSSYCNFGVVLADSGQLEQAVRWFAKAITTLDSALRILGTNMTARQFLRNSHWNRATILARLGRYAEAVPDWDRAVALDEGPGRNSIRLGRAGTLAQSGDQARATAEAEDIIKAGPTGADLLYDAACVFSLSSGKSKDAALAERYAARAIALLRQAVDKGYKNAAHMKQDTDLDPLHGRDDFKKLLSDLEAKAKAPGK